VLGGFLALLAAATFAFNNATLRRGVLTGTPAQAMAITVPLGVPFFLLGTAAAGALALLPAFTALETLSLCAAGLVHFIWGRYCNYRATKAIGANLVAPVQQFSMVFALGLAIWFLGEVLTPLRMLGILLVVIGPAITFRQGSPRAVPGGTAPETARPSVPAFEPRYGEGYLFALLSASGYGTSPVLVRLAIEGKGLGGGLAAGVVSYTAATVLILLFMLLPGRLAHVRAISGESAKWFTISGVLVCVSQMFTYMAMAIAPVTVVMPIQRLSLVFRIYCAKLITPDHEVFGPGIVLGTVVSLAGAVLLSLSTEAVLGWLSLSPETEALLRWRWP